MHSPRNDGPSLPARLTIGALVAVAALLGARPTSAQLPHATGVVCTTSPGPNPTFAITAQDGYIVLPDMNTLYMWGFSRAGEPFQHPGPVLCVNEGDVVTIVLHNTLPQDVSIVFPGQQNVLADGAPAQPQLGAGGALLSLTNVAPAGGGSVTYSFVASRPGAFVYESGTNPAVQVRMGLFGALVVRPSGSSTRIDGRADTRFTEGEEFMALLSELDPALHQAVELGRPFDLTRYHPRYWLINGRGFPDSIADNFASWLPSQPYGSLAMIHPYEPDPDAMHPHPFPGRTIYINVASQDFPFHPHGKNAVVVARDGRPLTGPGGQDLANEHFSLPLGPGQVWDALFKYYDAEHYDPVMNPVTVTPPDVQNASYGMFYSGSPYLGCMGPMPIGMQTLNEAGEFYIIAHNHALFQITSWGAVMTGPITFLRVEPPMAGMSVCP